MPFESNRRGFTENYQNGVHLTLKDLKTDPISRGNANMTLLLPAYPKPEFHLSSVKHETNHEGLVGIHKDSGFCNPHGDSLVWWSLVVTPNDMESAERRLLEDTYPDRTEEQRQSQPSFLEKFAKSTAFTKRSRLGAFRFTFPLRDVLDAYREQFCAGGEPVMRVYRTSLYRAEVMYSVLVHSPKHNQRFSDYPLLTDDTSSVCGYNGEMGYIMWKAEAMCGHHQFELVRDDLQQQMRARPRNEYPQYYLWDCVSLAFYVGEEVLTFESETLRDNLTICKLTNRPITYEDFDFSEAPIRIQKLWPDYQAAQEEPDQAAEEREQGENTEADNEGGEEEEEEEEEEEDESSIRTEGKP